MSWKQLFQLSYWLTFKFTLIWWFYLNVACEPTVSLILFIFVDLFLKQSLDLFRFEYDLQINWKVFKIWCIDHCIDLILVTFCKLFWFELHWNRRRFDLLRGSKNWFKPNSAFYIKCWAPRIRLVEFPLKLVTVTSQGLAWV